MHRRHTRSPYERSHGSHKQKRFGKEDQLRADLPQQPARNCFHCGKSGHLAFQCKSKRNEDTLPSASKSCNYCHKSGHVERDCFAKQRTPRPNVVQCVRPLRSSYSTPIATTLLEGKASKFSYIIDTGAEVSLIKESTVRRMNALINNEQTTLRTVGATVVCKGRCTLFVIFQDATLEIQFWVTPDNVWPGVSEALIGMDVIQRPDLELVKRGNYVDLSYHATFVPNVATLNVTEEQDLVVSGLVEVEQSRLRDLLNHFKNRTAPRITTGQLTVRLSDPTPVVHRPRHLAYAERVRVKSLVAEMMQEGMVRESQSEYASPIVLVSKKDGCACVWTTGTLTDA
jgi:hypothetical protein